jgi:xylitol oxidase
LIPVIEAALAAFEPRPHWGKLAGFGPAELAERTPRLDDFTRHGKSVSTRTASFGNPFLDDALRMR